MRALSIIILSREPENFLSGDKQIVQLHQIMRRFKHKYSLHPISKNDFPHIKDKNILESCVDFANDQEIKYENHLIIHFSNFRNQKNSKDQELVDFIHSFLSDQKSNENDYSVNIFILIISASLFTGGFHTTIFTLFPNIPKDYKKVLKKLRNMGFINAYPGNSDEYYYFHEKIAKYYFKKTFKKVIFYEKYLSVLSVIQRYYAEKENKLFSFLYAILLPRIPEEEIESHILFNNLVVNVNFKNLIYEMEFLLSQEPSLSKKYCRELGVLYDRTGALEKAKECFLLCLNNTNSIKEFFYLVQIDHSFYEQYPHIIAQTKEHKDIFYSLWGKYWELHMQMHKGNFNLNEYSELLNSCEKHYKQIFTEHQYDGVHFLRRCYFDFFRFYFLSGINDPSTFSQYISPNFDMKAFLSQELEEFHAYYLKFVIGSYIHYNLLFNLVLFDRYATEEDFISISNDNNIRIHNIREIRHHDLVISKIIEIYKEAIELLEKNKDKTAYFVRCRLAELKMIQEDFDSCEEDLINFHEFAEKEKDTLYKGYALTYLLKLQLIRYYISIMIKEYNKDRLDSLSRKIEHSIQELENYYKAQKDETNNPYVQLRLLIYKSLFLYSIRKDTLIEFQNNLKKIAGTAEKMNYQRERDLLKYINEQENELSTLDIYTIFKYYPIILQ